MLTKKDIIEKYNVSNQTIKRRTRDGLLHPISKGRINYYDEVEVENVFKNISEHDKFINLLREHYGYDPYTFIDEYKDNETPIRMKCNKCNNEIKQSPGNIKNNIRNNKPPMCKYCAAKRVSKSKNKGVENYKNKLKKYGAIDNYTINDDDFESLDKNMWHICNICGDRFEARPSNIINAYKSGRHYCSNCNHMKRDNRPYEERLAEINPNIIPLEPYKKRKVNITHKCLVCGHIWDTSPDNRLTGEGCPICKNTYTVSKGEEEVREFLKKFDDEVRYTDRKFLGNRQEIDIISEKYKLCIEYDGLYWHNEDYKDKEYHLSKTEICESNGYKLIHIYENEWENNRGMVENIIKNAINCDVEETDIILIEQTKTSCILTPVYGTKPNLNKILNEINNSSIYNDIIVELDRRFCSKYDNEYTRIGFEYAYTIEPDFIWFNKNLKTVQPSTFIDSTRDTHIWKKIWDCGKNVYRYKLR